MEFQAGDRITYHGRAGTVRKASVRFNPDYIVIKIDDADYPEFVLREEIQYEIE